MATLDFSRMTSAEKLDLIGELWDSIEADNVPLTAEQVAELDRRYATLDTDIKQGRDAFTVYDELTARYR
ncbi:addiction module protein [Niveispirillum irakense]|uniref:addiction module protein n=1 Tax=Niveispirillum irakense TaxID=34011 RepID=UPI000405967A|nr:addiction module protein [Niveispirillum irakense]